MRGRDSVTAKLTAAESLIDKAAATTGKKAHKDRQQAKTILKQVGAKVPHLAKGKKAKLSGARAAAIKGAAVEVAAGL